MVHLVTVVAWFVRKEYFSLGVWVDVPILWDSGSIRGCYDRQQQSIDDFEWKCVVNELKFIIHFDFY